MKLLRDTRVKIFADGANIDEMLRIYKEGVVAGFTTNPTLMKKSGVQDYRQFARSVLSEIRDLPISFEVFSDTFDAMEREAREIAGWGNNVNVKIPITDSKGAPSVPLIKKLVNDGLPLNVTALLTIDQVRSVAAVLPRHADTIVSVFAGRIADTGRDPVPHMHEAAEILKEFPGVKLLWASSRELYNIFQADEAGCHIITVTNDILKKLPLVGKDLTELSRETVAMFCNDARALGYHIL